MGLHKVTRNSAHGPSPGDLQGCRQVAGLEWCRQVTRLERCRRVAGHEAQTNRREGHAGSHQLHLQGNAGRRPCAWHILARLRTHTHTHTHTRAHCMETLIYPISRHVRHSDAFSYIGMRSSGHDSHVSQAQARLDTSRSWI